MITNLPLLVAVVEGSLLAVNALNPPSYEQVCDRVLMLQVDANDIPRTVTPDDINGVAAILIAGGATTPRDLELVGEQVLTYPYTRSATDVLDMPD